MIGNILNHRNTQNNFFPNFCQITISHPTLTNLNFKFLKNIFKLSKVVGYVVS